MQIQGGFNLGVFNSYLGNKVNNNNVSIPSGLKPLEKDTVSFTGLFNKPEIEPCSGTINFSNLSKRCNIQPKNRKYTIASMPNDMTLKTVQGKNGECELPLPNGSSNHKTIVVLDSFFKPREELSIGKNKVAHGELVAKIAADNLENDVAVLGIDVQNRECSTFDRESIQQALDDILEMKKRGVKIDGVNISSSYEVSYKGLSKDLGMDINEKNIAELKEQILEACRNSKFYARQMKTIDKINELVDNGIDVYVSAGNENFALETLSKAKTIGGKSPFGIKIFPQNEPKMPLITDYAPGVYNLKSMKRNGESGVGTKGIFISDSELLFPSSAVTIKGTSFAAPATLNSALKAR